VRQRILRHIVAGLGLRLGLGAAGEGFRHTLLRLSAHFSATNDEVFLDVAPVTPECYYPCYGLGK